MENVKSLPRRAYYAPIISNETILCEHSIAAGSARVLPFDSASQVQDEWETGTDTQIDQQW